MLRCAHCHCTNVELLGSLGSTKHYRCRDCGGAFYRAKPRPAASREEQLASAKRLLDGLPTNHPHRQALERKVQQLSA